jgi:hypothetical protein
MSDDDTPQDVLTAFSPIRRIVRNTVAVFLVTFFLLTMLLPTRLGAAISASLSVLYAVGQILGRRSCTVCGLLVSRAPWSWQRVSCPTCGGECYALWRSHN